MMSRHETHASCSPLHIEGTAPGDTLVVWILKLAPNRDVAISNVTPTGINAEWLEPGHLLRRGAPVAASTRAILRRLRMRSWTPFLLNRSAL